jgi:hypothetical protein
LWKKKKTIRFEVFTVIMMKSVAFWVVPCSLERAGYLSGPDHVVSSFRVKKEGKQEA